jgi:DNA-directed RNA polymerase subunit L
MEQGESLKSDYAASTEVGTLLRQGSALERYFRQQPGDTKGESEWNRLASDLKVLAAAYASQFPIGENPTFQRHGDREVSQSVKALESSAQQLRKSLDSDLKKDPSVDKASREVASQLEIVAAAYRVPLPSRTP